MCVYCEKLNMESELILKKKKIEEQITIEPYKENVMLYQLQLDIINRKLNKENGGNRNKIREIQ